MLDRICLQVTLGALWLLVPLSFAGCTKEAPNKAAPSGTASPDPGASTEATPQHGASHSPEPPRQNTPSPGVSPPAQPPKPDLPKHVGQPEPADETPLPPDPQLRELLAKATFQEGTAWKIDDAVIEDLAARGEVAVPGVLPYLQDNAVEVRRGAAVFLLERFDGANARARDALLAAAADRDHTVAHMAIQALTRVPKESLATVLPKLTALLAQPAGEANNRVAVVRLIGGLERDARDAGPMLEKVALQDASPAVRSAGVIAVSKVSDEPRQIQLFRQVLAGDKDAKVRLVAAARLRQLGSAAASASSELAAALGDSDGKVRGAVIEALVRLGDQATLPVAKQLDSPNAAAREGAVFVLGRLAAPSPDIVKALEKRLHDDDDAVRKLARAVLDRHAGERAP